MTYQQQRISKRGNCGDHGAIGAKCDVTTKPKHIATACIDIRGFPPDNGGEPISVVNLYADEVCKEAHMAKAATGLFSKSTFGRGVLLFFVVTMSGNVSAQAGDAERILKAMSDYLTSQKAMMVCRRAPSCGGSTGGVKCHGRNTCH